MSNTSSTGGNLSPETNSIEGDQLKRFLQSLISSMTGIQGDLVRPDFQIDPPKAPTVDQDWCAFGIREISADYGTSQKIIDGGVNLTRIDSITVFIAFYGPNSVDKAARLRDGFSIAQNREVLFLNGISVSDFSEIQRLADLVGQSWRTRSDLTITFQREVSRDYPILNFQSALGSISTQSSQENWQQS